MKLLALSAVASILLLAPAYAEDPSSSSKGPPKTMGDEGTLPSTSTVGEQVPSMGAQPAEPGSTPLTPKGPQETMGDEGKLPATRSGSGRVPDMTGPDQ
jgi:hypothetical protein